MGALPLHVASLISATLPSIFRTVLYAHEEAAKYLNREGQLPIHLACEGWANVVSVWELLAIYSEGAKVADNYGKTPLDHLMVTCRSVKLKEIPGSMMHKPKLDPRHYCHFIRAMHASIDLDILLWANAKLLLMALHHGNVPSLPPSEAFENDCFITVDAHGIPGVENFRALHAAIATGSHQDLIELTSTLYPNQYMEVDEDHGRLPLHWACISATHNMFYCFPCYKFHTTASWYHSLRADQSTIC